MSKYALFQHSLASLDIEAVGKALDAVPWLVRADAPTLVRRAFGVLADRLSRADAEALQQALAGLGARVEIVDQAWLHLPQPTPCRGAEVSRAGFMPRDLHGRAGLVPWRRILLLAAGRFTSTRRAPAAMTDSDIALMRERGWSRQSSLRTVARSMSAARYSYTDQEIEEVVLDVITDEPRRYRIHSDRFDYGYLGSRRGHSAAQNFPLLVRDVIDHATGAAHTQGIAPMARGAQTPPVRYPGPLQLNRECTWTLWRCCGPGTALDSPDPYRSAPRARPRLQTPLGTRTT